MTPDQLIDLICSMRQKLRTIENLLMPDELDRSSWVQAMELAGHIKTNAVELHSGLNLNEPWSLTEARTS